MAASRASPLCGMHATPSLLCPCPRLECSLSSGFAFSQLLPRLPFGRDSSMTRVPMTLSVSARGLVSAWCLHWFHSGIGLYVNQPCAQRASVDQCCPGERCAPPCPTWCTSRQVWGAVGLCPAAGAWPSAGPLTLESTQLPAPPSGISHLRLNPE